MSHSEVFCRWLIRFRWPLLALGLLLTAVAYWPAQQLHFDQTIENMFAEGDPLLEPYRKLKRTFGGNEIVLAAYVDPHLLTPPGVARVGQLGVTLAKLEGVRATLTIANTPLGPAIAEPDNAVARQFRELATGFTLGADQQTAAVVCLLKPVSETTATRQQTVDELRRLMQRHDPTGLVAGEPVMIVDGFRYLEADGRSLNIHATLLLVVTIFLCFRSVRWVVIPIAVVQATILWTQGLLVGLDLRLSMVSSMLAALITVVGIAVVLQLVVQFREARWAGLPAAAALAHAGERMLVPIVGAILADVVGFGSLLSSQVGPVQSFGLMTALGSFLVLGTCATLLPGLALAGSWDADPKRAWGEGHLDFGLRYISDWATRRSSLVLTLSLLIGGLAACGCLQLEVETDFTRNFRAESPVVRSYEFVESHLGGAGVWDVIIPAPPTLDWTFIEHVLKLERRLKTEIVLPNANGQPQPGLTKILSAADLLEALPGARLLPFSFAWSQLEAQQADFVQTLSHTDPDRPEQHYFRIMLRASERQNARYKQQLIADVTRVCRAEFPDTEVTGYYVLLTNVINSISHDQWFTFALATAGVAILLLILYRNMVVTLIALVPNAVPILMVTGLMGWLGLKINMGAAMIAAVSMGLSVRSSIMYLTALLRLRHEGVGLRAAVEQIQQSVGRAMVFSTLALVVGFSSLCLSDFVPTIYFGVLCSLTMLGGLIGNLIVLPLLVLILLPEKPSGQMLEK